MDRGSIPILAIKIKTTSYDVAYFYGGGEAQPVLTTSISKDFIYSFRKKNKQT
jgi:hypothetical protein